MIYNIEQKIEELKKALKKLREREQPDYSGIVEWNLKGKFKDYRENQHLVIK